MKAFFSQNSEKPYEKEKFGIERELYLGIYFLSVEEDLCMAKMSHLYILVIILILWSSFERLCSILISGYSVLILHGLKKAV